MTGRWWVAMLMLLALGVTSCAMSEETRCKKGGGVWRGTMCETPTSGRWRVMAEWVATP